MDIDGFELSGLQSRRKANILRKKNPDYYCNLLKAVVKIIKIKHMMSHEHYMLKTPLYI